MKALLIIKFIWRIAVILLAAFTTIMAIICFVGFLNQEVVTNKELSIALFYSFIAIISTLQSMDQDLK